MYLRTTQCIFTGLKPGQNFIHNKCNGLSTEKYMACEWYCYKKIMWQNMDLSEVPYLYRKKRAFTVTPDVYLLTCVCTVLYRYKQR